ncbi:MAG: hypothetical protein LC795_10315 [Acidobacteria bacterium]|nr:hypothetical protein [Acidobacteriota bacterium]
MRRRTLQAAALLLLLAATAAHADERIHQTRGSHTLEHRTTEKKRVVLPVRSAGRRVSIRVKAVVSGGEVRLVVRDSKGRVRQDARLRPAGAKPNTYDVSTDEERAAAGEWTVEFEFEEATGSYEYAWTNDLP